jgi:putative endonuclease
MKTKDIGTLGENIAARFLKKSNYKIVSRNLHVSHNEIDIIALNKKEKALVFVEVKARSVDNDLYSSFGTPASFVTKSKQARTIEAAKGYLANHNYDDMQIRFDVIEVYLKKDTLKLLSINHIENAFGV